MHKNELDIDNQKELMCHKTKPNWTNITVAKLKNKKNKSLYSLVTK